MDDTTNRRPVYPWRDVREHRMHAEYEKHGRLRTGKAYRWWSLTLSRGHIVNRDVRYTREPGVFLGRGIHRESDRMPAPKRTRCHHCDATRAPGQAQSAPQA